MDIEDLTKSQLLLLMILVSFVTSIATGILTVSLLDQAPPTVTQTINRIVERTVKTIAPVLPATVVKTIVSTPAPSTEDLVMSALASQSSRTVLIYNQSASTSTPARSVGVYIPSTNTVATILSGKSPSHIKIEFLTGTVIASTTLTKSGNTISLYHINDTASIPKTSTFNLVPKQNLKIGETILAVRGDGSAITGIISHITDKGFYTTLPVITAGIGVVDLSGNLVGISTGYKNGLFIPADVITSLLITKSATSTSTTISTS